MICSVPTLSTQGEGAEGYILDLRANPGGLVAAGLEVARLWLEGENVPVFNVRHVLWGPSYPVNAVSFASIFSDRRLYRHFLRHLRCCCALV